MLRSLVGSEMCIRDSIYSVDIRQIIRTKVEIIYNCLCVFIVQDIIKTKIAPKIKTTAENLFTYSKTKSLVREYLFFIAKLLNLVAFLR